MHQNDDVDVEYILALCLQNILDYLHVVILFFKFLKIRRRKQLLFKPHLLIQLLAGYRLGTAMFLTLKI